MAMAMEFRSYRDDAWYDVRIETQSNGDDGRRLRVRFAGFDDDHDEFIDGKDLRSPEYVAAVRSRFRAISAQLQDSECGQVHGGMVVCAAQSVCPDDRRFFDAVVDSVVRSEHKVENGEEQCACRFILSWKHGPNVGLLTDVALENICRVVEPPAADEQLDPKLMSFLNSALGSGQGTRVSGDSSSRDASSGSKTRRVNNAGKLQQETRFVRRSSSHLKGAEQAGDDIDIGGVPHMVIIENLEKRISPLTIMEFIHQQLSLSCQAFVSPSKLLETYTRAAILLDSKRKLDKLSAFLENPDHIVVSSSGRPWLMTETTPVPDTLRGLIETFMLTSQKVPHRRTGTCNELKVVISGTKEYEMAKKLKDLAGRFVDHLCQLHQRLVIEEGRLLEIPKPV